MTPISFTIVGAKGLVGSALCAYLRQSGHEVTAHDRLDSPTLEAQKASAGHLIFAAGVTADFRSRPHDAMQAHVSAATDLLRCKNFDSFLYLSSTRLYRRAQSTAESASFMLDPADADAPYDASKLAGEAICLADPRPEVRVARLSNVYDATDHSENFLSSLVRDAVGPGVIRLRSAPESAKDFIALSDVVRLLPRIAVQGRERVYNVAHGQNTRFSALLEALSYLTGCRCEIDPAVADLGPVVDTPIDVSRIDSEFPGARRDILEDLGDLVEKEREA